MRRGFGALINEPASARESCRVSWHLAPLPSLPLPPSLATYLNLRGTHQFPPRYLPLPPVASPALTLCVYDSLSLRASRRQCKDSALHTPFSNKHTHTHTQTHIEEYTHTHPQSRTLAHGRWADEQQHEFCARQKGCIEKDALSTAPAPSSSLPLTLTLSLYHWLRRVAHGAKAKTPQRFMDSMRVLSQAQKKGLSFHLVSRARYPALGRSTPTHTHAYIHLPTHTCTFYVPHNRSSSGASAGSGSHCFALVWLGSVSLGLAGLVLVLSGCLAVEMRVHPCGMCTLLAKRICLEYPVKVRRIMLGERRKETAFITGYLTCCNCIFY